jgi:PAS domain S-box-containing protein
MNGMNTRVLLIDDDEDDFILTQDLIQASNENYIIEWGTEQEIFKKSVLQNLHDIYLIDYRLGAITGIDLIKWAIQNGCHKPIIILTGQGDDKIDREAMLHGAYDYLIKDKIDTQSLSRTLRYSIERWKTTQALKISEENYKSIFENTKDVIYITKPDGQFLTFNESIYSLFGYAKDELLNMSIGDLYLNPKDRETFIHQIEQNKSISDFEVTMCRKNGDEIHCLISASVQKDQNNNKIYQGLIHDITLRKQHEQDLLHTEKRELSSRIARMIAHEIRNPLTNIDLSITQLAEEVPSNDDITLYVDIIKRNSKRINELITDLLQSSKPNIQEKSITNLAQLTNQALNKAIDRIQLKNIQLIKEFSTNDIFVQADEKHLEIALLNIIINAIEAMTENYGKLHVKLNTENNNVILSISDNGCGIKPEHLNKLFDPYFTNKPNGMGLGLTSTQNIINSLDGQIKVISSTGKGTTFLITLKLITTA